MRRRAFQLLETLIAFGILGGIVMFSLLALEQGQWAQTQTMIREQALDLAEMRLHQVVLKPLDFLSAKTETLAWNGTSYAVISSAVLKSEVDLADRYLAKVTVSWKVRDKTLQLERQRYVHQEP